MAAMKLAGVSAVSGWLLWRVFQNMELAYILVFSQLLYAFLGGYIDLLKEGGVPLEKLPAYERQRLSAAQDLLQEDLRRAGVHCTPKLYLVPGDDLQGTCYGRGAVSVTTGTLENSDVATAAAVLAHEISHARHLDAETSRAVFFLILIAVFGLGTVSLIATVMFVTIMLAISRSWVSGLVCRGGTHVIRGFFGLAQKILVVTYQLCASAWNRHVELRADADAAALGYGPQLARFLDVAAPDMRALTVADALYRTHPATAIRVARLEAAAAGNRLVRRQ